MKLSEKDSRIFPSISSTPTAIFNSEGDLVHANQSFLKLWNINQSEQKRFNLFHNLMIPKDIITKLKKGQKINYELKISPNEQHFQAQNTPAGNQIKQLNICLAPFTLNHNSKDAFILQMEGTSQEGVINDISLTFLNLFKILWANSREGIFIIDYDFNILYVNKQFSKILDLKIVDILGEDIRKFFENSNFERLISNAEEFKNELKHEKREFSITTNANEKKIVELLNLEIHKLQEGKRIYAQVVDITEKKKTEQKLAESEKKFEMLGKQDLMSIAIFQDNEIKYANEHFGEGMGYSKEDLRNWTLDDLIKIIHPADREFVFDQARKKQIGAEDTVSNYPFRVIHKDGHIVWRQVYSNTIKYKGKPAILATYIDITEWKKTEKQLKESEEKFRKIVESIPDLFFLVAKDSTILDYQASGERLYLPPKDFMNNQLVKLLPHPLGEKAQRAIYRTLNTHKSQVLEYSLPIQDQVRYYEARLFYYSEEQVAIFIRDITERRKAEQMIKEEIKRLKEIDQMRRDLISRVSHELKTPLMAISGAVEYILEILQQEIDDEVLELLEMVDLNKERLQTLIDTLLDVSKIKNKKLKLNKTLCNLSEIINKVSRELEHLRKERDIDLKLDLSEGIKFYMDKVRISEVIMNLLSNAIKNTPPGGHITIKTRKRHRRVKIMVSDTGIGLTEKERSKIFTQFGKIERYGEGLEYLDISGSGLGLYLSNKIVELHNGHIQVESGGRNKGSTFKVILPFDEEARIQ